MPLKLNIFERIFFLKFPVAPTPILDMFGSLAFQAVNAGHKLNVFEVLETNGKTTSIELAKKLEADEKCLKILLETLEALGYVSKKNKIYFVNSKATKRWMLKSSKANMSQMLGYYEDAFSRWTTLEKSIKLGHPFESGNDWLGRHDGSWDKYHASLRGVAELISDKMISAAKIPENAKTLLDIGGSHGLYSVKFCEKYTQLKADVFDIKEAQKTAMETIVKYNMEDRISFVEGNFHTDKLENHYDVVLLFNTLRIFSRKEAVASLEKAKSILNKGGVLLVADQFCQTMNSSFSKANALLIELELVNSSSGVPYSSKEVSQMLKDTGFSQIKESLTTNAGGVSVISARNE